MGIGGELGKPRGQSPKKFEVVAYVPQYFGFQQFWLDNRKGHSENLARKFFLTSHRIFYSPKLRTKSPPMEIGVGRETTTTKQSSSRDLSEFSLEEEKI